MIELGQVPASQHEMWHVLFELDEQYTTGWTLIGAQMVALHAAEHSRTPPRSSEDADVLVDARILKPKPHHIARALLDRGFDPEITSAQIAHRFVCGRVSIDVLAPDGLDDASKALRTVPPNVTVQVPGGSQALQRTERKQVRVGTTEGFVPRPNLLGAILVKARAVTVDERPDAQRLDLAFLCSLVEDPRTLRAEMTSKESSWLRARAEMADGTAAVWVRLGPDADNAYRAFQILMRDG